MDELNKEDLSFLMDITTAYEESLLTLAKNRPDGEYAEAFGDIRRLRHKLSLARRSLMNTVSRGRK